MRIAVVTGNPKPASRTHGAALAVAGACPQRWPARAPPAPTWWWIAASLFDSADAQLSRLTAQVAAADIAIFASPTYKASQGSPFNRSSHKFLVLPTAMTTASRGPCSSAPLMWRPRRRLTPGC